VYTLVAPSASPRPRGCVQPHPLRRRWRRREAPRPRAHAGLPLPPRWHPQSQLHCCRAGRRATPAGRRCWRRPCCGQRASLGRPRATGRHPLLRGRPPGLGPRQAPPDGWKVPHGCQSRCDLWHLSGRTWLYPRTNSADGCRWVPSHRPRSSMLRCRCRLRRRAAPAHAPAVARRHLSQAATLAAGDPGFGPAWCAGGCPAARCLVWKIERLWLDLPDLSSHRSSPRWPAS